MQKLIIFGISSLARQLLFYFDNQKKYQVIGFALDEEYITSHELCGLPIFSTQQLINLAKHDNVKCFLALGYKNMRLRKDKFNQLKSSGIEFVSYISPDSVCYVAPSDIGDNVMILANSTIEPFTVIGDNTFVWSGVTICHDVKVKGHSFIAAGTIVGGNSTIGENCFLGFGATISNGINLADETLVAANSFVNNNTEVSSAYAGSPSIKKKSHLEEGIQIDAE